VALLREKQFLDQVVITSLDHASLQQVEQLQPGLETGLIVTAAVGNVLKTDTDFVSLNSRARPRASWQSPGRRQEVHVWTVNKPEVMLRMIERDVDNVITDDRLRWCASCATAATHAARAGGRAPARAVHAIAPELEDASAVPRFEPAGPDSEPDAEPQQPSAWKNVLPDDRRRQPASPESLTQNRLESESSSVR